MALLELRAMIRCCVELVLSWRWEDLIMLLSLVINYDLCIIWVLHQ